MRDKPSTLKSSPKIVQFRAKRQKALTGQVESSEVGRVIDLGKAAATQGKKQQRINTTISTERLQIFTMPDSSMVPAIPPGTSVGIYSDLEPRVGDFVLANINGNETLRQLDHDGCGGFRLNALNGVHLIVSLDCARILGVAGQMYVRLRPERDLMPARRDG